MASSSNQARNFDSTVDIDSSSVNIFNSENSTLVEGVCESADTSLIEEFVEGFDESFSRTTKLWNPKVTDNKFKPYSGQRFDDIEACFDFYTEYGRQGGFNVRKSTQHTKNDKIVLKYIVCSKAGHHETSMSKFCDSKSDSSHTSSASGVQVRRRRTVTKKTECDAKVILKYLGSDGGYIISCFIEGHNHPLATESGKEFLRANRSMTALQRHFLLDAARTNIGAFRAHGLYKNCFGLYSDIGPTAVDFQNWMRDIKLYIGKHDADMLLAKFKTKHETSDGGFFYEYQTDSNGHLTRLFWTDVRGRKYYEVFGDVVSFDATYRTNKYGMVFVPFIGVDNHWKSITFASALLDHENETNFTWACQMFLQIFQRPPKCIITDQCPAMKVSIAATFPHSMHRYCMWHVMQKFPAKIGPVFCAESGFMEKLNKFVWSSHLTVTEFEEGWDAVLKEFGLSEHVWLNEIYAIRESWIPAFFRDKQMGALLRTTSRSESSNFYFNHFVQKGDTLSEFYMCYECAIDKQLHETKKLDNGDSCLPQLITEKQIEKHASYLYTRNMFYKVQKQIKASCFHISLASQPTVVDGVNRYVVRDKSFDDRLFEVEFSFSNNDVACSCKLFTRVGYLCRHCFYILGLWGVERIPQQFLSCRWMKNALEKFCTLKFPNEFESSSSHIIRDTSKQILSEFQGCFGKVSNDIEGLKFMLDEMKSLKTRVEGKFKNSATTKDDILEETFGVRPSGSSTVLPPLESNNKGSRKRIIRPGEISRDGKKRKLKMCKSCNTLGYHDSRKCPKKGQQLQQNPSLNQSMQPQPSNSQNVHTNGIPNYTIEVQQTECAGKEGIESNTCIEGADGDKH